MSTSSTERTGDKRWDVFNASVTTNPDLARLARLQTSLVASTPLEANTPLVGIGMSNGARFVTLWGQAWKNAGYPVKAIWASHGNAAPSVEGAGKLTVPTVFSTAVNDFTVPPGQVIADYTTAHNAGTPSRALPLPGAQPQLQPVSPHPRHRHGEAKEIVQALEATGVWDAQGKRIVSDVGAGRHPRGRGPPACVGGPADGRDPGRDRAPARGAPVHRRVRRSGEHLLRPLRARPPSCARAAIAKRM